MGFWKLPWIGVEFRWRAPYQDWTDCYIYFFTTLITPTSSPTLSIGSPSPILSIGSPGPRPTPHTHTLLSLPTPSADPHLHLADKPADIPTNMNVNSPSPLPSSLSQERQSCSSSGIVKFFPFLFLTSRGGGEVVEEGPVESVGECAKSSAMLVGQVTKSACGGHETRAFHLLALLYLEGPLCVPTCIGLSTLKIG